MMKRATRAIPSESLILGPLSVETPGSPLGPFVGKAFRSISGTSLDAPRIFERMDRLYATGLFDGRQLESLDGSRDIAGSLHAVPALFPASDDITLFRLDDAGHNHNVAPTREQLWARLGRWAHGVSSVEWRDG
jgi:hypothetical protein